MSDVILSGDFTIYYTADAARKQIKWTGSATGTRTANQLYSALQDLFDELANMDDGIPMSAQTPTEYTIGAIDASDDTPWFIDDETIQHITGGAIKTNLWTRVTGAVGTGKPGIVKVSVSANTSIVYGDIGNAVTCTAGASSTGVLVGFKGSGATTVLYIRPTDSTSTHDFTGATTITCNGHTTGVMTCTVATGESLWANIYSLGSLTVDLGKNPTADLYVYRAGSKVTALSSGASAYQWWPTGHIDILMKVKEAGATPFTGTTSNGVNTITGMNINAGLLRVGQPVFGSGIPAGTTIASITSISAITMSANATGVSTNCYVNTIDAAYVTVFAREFDTTYDYFTVDLNSGGRNPIPLATGSDLNNAVGIKQITAGATSTGTFVVGEIIYVGGSVATATIKGVVTKVTGTTTSSNVRYSLIGDVTVDFTTACTGASSGAVIANGTVADNADLDAGLVFVNPKSFVGSGLGITFGAFTDDINNGAGTKSYAIKIDPGANKYTLAKMYEWTKYVTRRGSVDTTNNNGINGERYIGAETILTYTSAGFGTYAAGTVVFQSATGAYGTVIAHDNTVTTKFILLRNVRGAFNASSVTDGTNATVPTGVNTFTPIKPNPYGSFAGGKFFAATGVMFNRTNLASSDIQAYQLTALDASTQVPPNIVSVGITGLSTGDAAGVFQCRALAGVVDKAAYTMPTVAAAGGTTVNVTSGTRTAIGTDEPQAGYIRIVKTTGTGITQEHRYRYASWATTTFTLATVTTGQGAVLTATAADYWNSQTGAIATGGNLLRVTLGTAISASEIQVGDMVFTAASGTPTTSIAQGSIVKIEDTTHLWIRVYGTVTLGNWSGVGNVITFNKLATTYANTDKLYVPIVDSYISAGSSVSNSLIYSSDIPVLVRVRQYKTLLPFEQTTSVGSTGLSVSAIRSSDSIAS